MKLKNIFKFATVAAAVGTLSGVTSCNYLDIVPPEQPGLPDAMKNHTNAEGFLYSCYKGVSQRDFSPRDYRSPLNCANDEFLIPEVWMSIDGPSAYAVMRNTLQTTPTSYDPGFWNNYYNAIGQTLLFERELDSTGRDNEVWNDENEYKLWKAEAKFCRAFYHYQLFRLFGPVPITTRFINMDADPSEYPGRMHADGLVNWIVKQLDEVTKELDDQNLAKRNVEDLGRASSTITRALKSRLLLMAASPLWNGQFPYRSWTNKTKSIDPVTGEDYGYKLFADKFEAEKWDRAILACQEAVKFAEDNGYKLYDINAAATMNTEDVLASDIYIPGLESSAANSAIPQNWIDETGQATYAEAFAETVRMLRYINTTTYDEGNTELIWTNQQVPYGTDNSRLPRRVVQREDNGNWLEGWNGVSPTLFTVEHFLTANGLTPATDASFDFQSRYTKAGLTDKGRDNVLKINLNREPRYYAFIAFDGGDYLTRIDDGNPKTLNMRSPDMQGRGAGERNYSVTGFLSMKHVDPLAKWAASNGAWTSGKNSPDVLFRLAELYLNLAECYAEYAVNPELTALPAGVNLPEGCSNATDAAIHYVNLIRKRALAAPLKAEHLGMVDENGKKMDIREWVRNERFVELWDEGHRYHDVRRWAKGDEYFGYGKRKGLNGLAVDPKDDFERPIMVNSQYIFHKRLYLWPLYQSEVYNNPQMVQAPGY